MALKPDRNTIDWGGTQPFMNSTAERGGIVCISATTASGVGLDQSVLTAEYKANPSGAEPFGMLYNDVVNKDLTQTHLDLFKDEVQVGSSVTAPRICEVVTDFVYPGHTPTPGQIAYLGHSGYIGNADVATDHVDSTGTTRQVGRWITAKNHEGFARIRVNIK